MLIDNCYAAYINLDHRTDRHVHMVKELGRVEIKAERLRAFKTSEHIFEEDKVAVMRKRTPGAIGCWYSQVEVMKLANSSGKHAFVMEDDLVFCTDIKYRLEYLENYLKDKKWDVIWLGGTFHTNPPYWHTGNNPELKGSAIGKDAECTDDPRIMRTYGAFSTHAYIVNKDSIPLILSLLYGTIHEAMGIDWAFIKLQPYLKTYAFVPGCVKQMDNMSDIGQGMTIFSGFSKLGPYWWQDLATDFDPTTYNWGEAK